MRRQLRADGARGRSMARALLFLSQGLRGGRPQQRRGRRLPRGRGALFFLEGGFMRTTRRDFLSITAAGTPLAGGPARWGGTAHPSDAPGTPKKPIGLI